MNKVKLICFDMDETLIKQNSWYVLNIALGITPEEDLEMYEAYVRGELPYDEWTSKLVTLYKERGLATRENIITALSAYELKEGATDLVTYLHQKNYQSAIISGSFDVLVDLVADKLTIPLRKANTRLLFDDAGFLSEVASQGEEKYAKLQHLENFCSREGIDMSECLCIGDGANDIELFKATNRGVTFTNAPEVVKESAWKVVHELSDIKTFL